MFKIGSKVTADTNEASSVGQHSPGSGSNGSSSSRKNTLLDTKRLQNIGLFCALSFSRKFESCWIFTLFIIGFK